MHHGLVVLQEPVPQLGHIPRGGLGGLYVGVRGQMPVELLLAQGDIL